MSRGKHRAQIASYLSWLTLKRGLVASLWLTMGCTSDGFNVLSKGNDPQNATRPGQEQPPIPGPGDPGASPGQDPSDPQVQAPLPFSGKEWFVKEGSQNGNGSQGSPFGSIQAALDVASPGDGISILPGTYNEAISTVSDGSKNLPIVIQAKEGRGTVEIQSNGRVLNVRHSYNYFAALIFSGEYGTSDLIRVSSEGDGWLLHNSEVRYSSRDCIDMISPADVSITHSLVHHCLNAEGGRTDAHGIVASSVRNLLIQNTDVHTFSGDAFQVDPGRTAPGWDNVTIDRCRFWLTPLPQAANGFAAGTVAGENAIDTKVRSGTKPRLFITNSQFWGFKGGLISNMSALNLKESVVAKVDRNLIFDSEIALRLRFPAEVDISNTIVHSSEKAVRYEDDIALVKISNSTFGQNIDRLFQEASSDNSQFDIRNSIFIGNSLPAEARASNNLAAARNDFVNIDQNDYRLSATSQAIDKGQDLGLLYDYFGNARLQGGGVDLGAIESY